MQVKKDNVQKAIVKAATEEFLKNGFEGSSMRRMAAAANTGLGNFYNYFKSKNELFAFIVGEQYSKMQSYIAKSLSDRVIIDFQNIRDTRLFSQELRRFLMRGEGLYTKQMLLLLDCSRGTRFYSAKDELVAGLVQILGHICEVPKKPEIISSALFFEQTINSLVQTARKYIKSPKLKEMLFNSFHAAVAGYMVVLINN